MQSLLSGLVSYWPLHEVSGSRYDATGTGNTLTDNNTVLSTNGKADNAALFARASSEYLSLTDNVSVSPTDKLTIALWAHSTGASAGDVAMVNKAASYGLEIAGTAGANDHKAQFFINATYAVGTTLHNDSVFRFFVGRYDRVNVEVWINMVMEGQTAMTAAIPDNANPFYIGRTGGYWDGAICEVGMWHRALTITEMDWLYNNNLGRTWPFDGRPSPILSSRRGHGVMARRNKIVGAAF